MLYGRRTECERLDELLAAARSGRGGALVLRGEAGTGKTALLDYAADAAADLRVIRAAAVAPEADLAFAGLHQICTPLLGRLEDLPVPQRDALEVVFGRRAGPAPDQFLAGLAVLSLLAGAAADGPLVCVIDDGQWLDRASGQALAFAARRLQAEPVAMLFAIDGPESDARWADGHSASHHRASHHRASDHRADHHRADRHGTNPAGLAELAVGGLREADARDLLAAALPWPLDGRVRDRIVAETGGNPRALTELARGLSPARLAGGFGLAGARSAAVPVEPVLERQLAALPAQTRLLLVVAAAEPAGDPALVWRAAGRLGIPAEAATAAAAAGLAGFGPGVRFRDQRVRSAAYQLASLPDRQAAHRALAEATDPLTAPDWRAWHRAEAAPGPDETVAAELARTAGQAQARGGLAAAGAFLGRAAILSLDQSGRSERALAAARAMVQAGAFDEARDLLELAGSGIPGGVARAGDVVRGGGVIRGGLDALYDAMFADHVAGPGLALSRAPLARVALPRAGLAEVAWDRTALPLSGFRRDMPVGEELRWLWLVSSVALYVWDHRQWDALTRRYVRLARDAGALGELPLALDSRTYVHLFAGELATAATLADEARTVSAATGSALIPGGPLILAALRGRQAEARALISAMELAAARPGAGVAITTARWAGALLGNGLGQYADALAAAGPGGEDEAEFGPATWSRVELIEAAARTGQPGQAAAALRLLSESTQASGTSWALGVEARCRALLSAGEAAEDLYLTALDRLGQGRTVVDLARTHLLYGEWLRRENRRTEAREQLRRAHQMLTAMGAEAFAERARRELLATGEMVRKRTVESVAAVTELTDQEAQIARRARAGRTNAEIGMELFLSPRTVEWHLRKVFAKLGITSRRELTVKLAEAVNGEAVLSAGR